MGDCDIEGVDLDQNNETRDQVILRFRDGRVLLDAVV
jgi:hypothetical protein